jgi:ATP-dependent DNA ligase
LSRSRANGGFRIMARRDAKGVRLTTRNGRDTQKEE